MATLYLLVEQARNILSGGTPNRDAGLHFQDMMMYAKQLLAESVRISLFENMKEGESMVDGSFVFTFDNQPVAFDTSKNLYYSTLPSAYINLPNEAGVDMVCLMQGQDMPFVKVPRNFLSVSRGLGIADLEGGTGYWTEGRRIYYTNMSGITPQQVMIKLVGGVDTIDETTEIGLPYDIQKRIVDGLIDKFSIQLRIPEDETNNHSINT